MNLRAGRNERAVSVAQEYKKARARSTAGDKMISKLVSMGRNQGNVVEEGQEKRRRQVSWNGRRSVREK